MVFIGTVFSSLVIMADDAGPPWVAARTRRAKKNPILPDDKSIAAGKTIYIAQCLKCHGDTGKGDGPSAKDLDRQAKGSLRSGSGRPDGWRTLLENHHRPKADADI